MKKLWLTAVFSAFVLILAGAENHVLFQYDFSRGGKLDLQRKAKLANGVLALDGKGDFAYVPDSAGLHYGKKGTGVQLKTGMAITIEPMINQGVWQTKVMKDGWTAITKDNLNAAPVMKIDVESKEVASQEKENAYRTLEKFYRSKK